MTIWAIIPVKPLHDSKRRLAHLLSAEARAELIHHFLDNLLATLNDVPGIDRVLVVTGDAEATALAQNHGAAVLLETEPSGLNEAATRGAALAARQGATAVLILPADLPFARVEDIEQMLAPLPTAPLPTDLLTTAPLPTTHHPLLAITGDETEEGTNALLLAPPGDFTFHYGPGSYHAHLNEAAARGRTTCIINAPGLRFDLDTEGDWLAYCGCLIQAGDE
ncbi:MAG TPA: 2-phospho-L-lactate guanylyltransferase [Promineifilum sp.]|nr:2-phospho-L-lactate guanylyltransferase [Promineifilum sp.]